MAIYAKNELGLDHIELREYKAMGVMPFHVQKGKRQHLCAVDELMKVLARNYPTQYLMRLRDK